MTLHAVMLVVKIILRLPPFKIDLNHFLKRIICEVVLKLKIKFDKINFLKNFRAWELIKCLGYQGNSYFHFSKRNHK